MRAMTVTLLDEQGNEHQTATRVDGSYSFYNLPSGKYTLVAGDQRHPVTIAPEVTPLNPVRLDAQKVRRPIDLHQSPVWEVSRELGLPSDTLRQIVARLPRGADLQHLGKEAGVDSETIKSWGKTVVVHVRHGPSKPTPNRTREDDDADDRGSSGPKRRKRK